MSRSRQLVVLCVLASVMNAQTVDFDLGGEKPVRLHKSTSEIHRVLRIEAGTSWLPTIHPRSGSDGESASRDWPVFLNTPGAGFPYTPTLFDADGDGDAEIFLTGGHTFALQGDGTFLPGWPTSEMEYMGYGTTGSMPGPSAADLEGDGVTDVMWTLRDWYAGSSFLWCFNGKKLDGTNMPGFPQEAPDQSSNALDTPFVLGDTDGDGDLEAWGAHTLGNAFTYYRVSAFDHEGTRLFTVDLDPDENIHSLYFGDVDGNGSKEMFAVSWLDPSFVLHVFEADGSEAAGYPVTLHTFSSGYLMFGPPIPADLDGDGDLEVLLGHWDGGGSHAYCHHHDGASCVGFPIHIATSSQLFYLGLGDVTGDQEPELIALDNHLGGAYRAFVVDLGTGTTLPGWPYGIPDWPKGFPTVVDVDNSGVQDICFVTDGAELYAVSGTGALIHGFPKNMISPSISGVGAGDIDGDGFFELVAATWDGWVYAWDTLGPAVPGRADWPMRGLNSRNTGVFGDLDPLADIRLTIELDEQTLVLMWEPFGPADHFWIYGAANDPWFDPGFAPSYEYRLAVVPGSTTTWTSSLGVGSVETNWTFLVMAVDQTEQELLRSNRVGEFDYMLVNP